MAVPFAFIPRESFDFTTIFLSIILQFLSFSLRVQFQFIYTFNLVQLENCSGNDRIGPMIRYGGLRGG